MVLIAASSKEPNINLQLLCKKTSSFINHIANMVTCKENRKNSTNVTSVIRVELFLFSIHKIDRPTDADKIANLVQHPKSFGTAVLKH